MQAHRRVSRARGSGGRIQDDLRLSSVYGVAAAPDLIGLYEALLVRDGRQSDAAVALEEKEVGRDDTLTLEMIDGGGFVGRFSR